MTGYDFKKYKLCVKKCNENVLDLGVIGDDFVISKRNDNTSFGRFANIQNVFDFLCGYEWGIETIK